MTSPPPQSPRPAPGLRGALAGAILLGTIIALLSGSLILLGQDTGRGYWDEREFHEPAVRLFIEQWPSPDVSDYASATTPGYHLALAAIARHIGDDLTTLRLLAMGWSVALFALLGAWLGARVGMRAAMLLSLPMFASVYVLFPGVWLLPDNMGWLGVLTIVLLALSNKRTSLILGLGGLVLVGLVLARQIHIWAACVLWAAAWLGDAPKTRLFTEPRSRVQRTIVGVVATIPAFALLAWFLQLWGGLSPPRFQEQVHGGNPATPAFLLMEHAIILVPMSTLVWPALARVGWRGAGLAFLAALAGGVLAWLPESGWSPEAGRYSGWWNIVRSAPMVEGRSALLLALAPVGAAALTLWMLSVPPRTRWVLLGALAGFTAAQTASNNCWQRYHEPFLLILAALMGAEIWRTAPIPTSRRAALVRVSGPVLLSVLFGAIMLRGLTQPPHVDRGPDPALTEQKSPPADGSGSTAEPARPMGVREDSPSPP